MGSSNLNCAVSNFPINRGERVKCIFLMRPDMSRRAPYYPWGEWQFASLPIEVTMGDYSTPEGVLDCEGSGTGMFDVKTDFEKRMYNLFVDRVFVYPSNSKTPVTDKLAHAGDDRHHWYHIARYGDYDFSSGWCDRYDPEQLKTAKTPLLKSFYTFDPTDIAVMFINKDVYKHLTTVKKSRKESFKDVETMFSLLRKYHDTPETQRDHRSDILLEIVGDRYEFLNNRMWGRIKKVLLQDKNVIDLAEVKFKEIYTLAYNMWNVQVPIRPSHGLSPQGGWYNDMSELVKWQKKLLTIAQKRNKPEE